MEFAVYILQDESGKLYKGMTRNLEQRLVDHKRGKTLTTSRMSNLKLVYTEKFATFEQARERELYFKSAAGRRFLKKKLGP